MASQPELLLVLVGFGNVARRFVSLLDEMRDRLPFTWRIVGITSRSTGGIFDPVGIDAVAVARGQAEIAGASPGDGRSFLAGVLPLLSAATAKGRAVVVETTVLDAAHGEPATTHVRQALEAGAHAVTANKGPTAFAYRELADTAARVNRAYLFEGAVMDGVPIFSLAADTMPGLRVLGFRGVVNTTCAFIVTEMERGVPFADALADMQARGIAEADPTLDIDGWDAAAKAAALANVLLDARVTPHDVVRQGIASLTGHDLAAAAATGRKVRLVASGARDGDVVTVRVQPEWLEASDPLAAISGDGNALYLSTDVLGEIGIVQRSGSLTHTAYALVADLARISRRPTDRMPA